MASTNGADPPPAHNAQRSWIPAILGDIQFWIPLAVFTGGLILLNYVQ